MPYLPSARFDAAGELALLRYPFRAPWPGELALLALVRYPSLRRPRRGLRGLRGFRYPRPHSSTRQLTEASSMRVPLWTRPALRITSSAVVVVPTPGKTGSAARHARLGPGEIEDVVADRQEQAERLGAAHHRRHAAVEAEPGPCLVERRGRRVPQDGVGIVRVGRQHVDPAGQDDAAALMLLRSALGRMAAVDDRRRAVDRVPGRTCGRPGS